METLSDVLWRYLYICMAAIAGAVTALGAMRWREMTRLEIFFTLAGGFSFAIFVTPWVAHSIMGVAESNIRAIAALTYVFGSASNILLPVIIRKIRRVVDEGETR